MIIESLSMTVPPGFDASAARPRVVLHFHLSEAALRAGHAVVRPEDGGPLTLEELVEFLGRSRCQVRIQPVLDPTEVAPIDGYEVPQRLRAAVRARQIADVFPFGTCLSPKIDLDHTERYVPMDYGGPPGQTRLGNLGPMARPSHRAVTHGGWPNTSPSRATSCTAHPSDTSTWSPTKAPSPSAAPTSAPPSGRPQRRNQPRSPPS